MKREFEDKEPDRMADMCDHPIPVTDWYKDRDSIQFVINDLQRQRVRCVIRKRETTYKPHIHCHTSKVESKYSVWRQMLPGDHCDQFPESVPHLKKILEASVEVERY